jgi:photosystem II stability/assembly factor-like uncharacterized protein
VSGSPIAAGTLSALVVDPRNSSTVYVGSDRGGVWKTVDGGLNWMPLTDSLPAPGITALALDPANPEIVYAGTGATNSLKYYLGAGILKSSDAGNTWTILAPGLFSGSWVTGIAVSPSDSNVILAIASPSLYRSADAGITWTKVFSGVTIQVSYVPTVLFDPVQRDTAYVLSPAGVQKSTDGGQTWSLLSSPVTAAACTGGIEYGSLVQARSDLSVFYLSAVNCPTPSYRSNDGAQTWTALKSAPAALILGVSPANPSVVFAGAIQMYRSLDAGNTWQNVSYGSTAVQLHVDRNIPAFSADGTLLYVGTDGGVWSSANPASESIVWNNLDSTLATAEFYSLAVNPNDVNVIYGGTQDNGTIGYAGNGVWSYLHLCGDGGAVAIDPSAPSTAYFYCGSDYSLWKSLDSGNTFGSIQYGVPKSPGGIYNPLVIDPSSPQRLYFGSQALYTTANGGANWEAAPLKLANSQVSAIGIGPSDSNTLYVSSCVWPCGGMPFGAPQLGRMYLTITGPNGPWSSISAGLPTRAPVAIAVSPSDSRTAYVVFGGFNDDIQNDVTGHVFKTADAGTTWTEISGNLPDVPLTALVLDPDLPGTMYVGSDYGVFWTGDGGNSWSVLGKGLPLTTVSALVLHQSSRTLIAATYGRGVWTLKAPRTGQPAPQY